MYNYSITLKHFTNFFCGNDKKSSASMIGTMTGIFNCGNRVASCGLERQGGHANQSLL